MKKKIVWMVVSGLMALSLVMAACGQAEEGGDVAEEEVVGGAVMKNVTLTKLDGSSVVVATEKPEYGGTLTRSVTSDSGSSFDPGITRSPGEQHPLGFNVLLDGDPARGPVGTHETDWNRGNFMGYVGLLKPSLAESYEIVDEETMIFKIRQGVHFAVNPEPWAEASRLVNGRELTAEDIAWSIERQWNEPTSYHAYNHPNQRLQSATALDKYTLEIKILPNQHGLQLLQTAGRLPTVAREVIEKYGDMTDWKNVVGTGSYILTEYVPESIRVYTRNPNYFEMDPFFPENRLPYIETVKRLVIPDRSTILAALRTGQLDEFSDLTWDESEVFMRDNPDILQKRRLGGTAAPAGRMDKPELPWAPQEDENALKVRRAMNMAINKQALVDDYYGGNAVLFSDPWTPIPDYEGIFRPLETFSKEVQELYEYNPEKAKQLLAEAGYPDGFRASIVTMSNNVDLFSILKDNLSKVGVDLVIDVKERGAYSKLANARSFPEYISGWNGIAGMPWKWHQFRVESQWTDSYFDHPDMRAAYDELQLVLGRDDAKVREIYASVSETFLEAAPQIFLPKPYTYTTWWPWLKRYEGMRDIGVYNPGEGYDHFSWIDQDMKKEMGY